MRHPGLRIRMALAGSVLFAIYALFALVLQAGGIPLVVIVALSAGFVGFQYYVGKKLPLWRIDARDVDEDRFGDLVESVERLSDEMGVETPRLMVADMGVPNAFTVGRRGAAVVVMGSELLYVLDEEQVEGVLAHELAHVRNRDVTVMALGSSIASMVGLTLEYVITALPASKGGNRLVGYIVGSLIHLSIMVFVLAISRYREYVADAEAAGVVGSDPLASALAEMRDVGQRSPASVSSGVAALCIFGGNRGFFERLFATHPPIEQRIERLQSL